MSKKRMFPILYMLPTGKENAITTEELVKLSGCGSARELQKQIAFEREHGALICSGAGRGYWRPKDYTRAAGVRPDHGRKVPKHTRKRQRAQRKFYYKEIQKNE